MIQPCFQVPPKIFQRVCSCLSLLSLFLFPTFSLSLSLTPSYSPSLLPSHPQLLKIGFDEETSQLDTKNLLQQVINIRHPSRITRGLKWITPLNSPEGSLSQLYAGREPPLPKNKSKNDPKSRGVCVCACACACACVRVFVCVCVCVRGEG